jgi:serine/threonine-protein kinase
MTERFGQYELIQKIAAGGMAEIFFARLTGVQGFSRNLVVKRMLPELAVRKDFVQMFLDEARLAANLSHAHIVQVFELGEVDGSYFMAMEFVDGPHLGALFAHSLRQRKPLPLDFCAYVVARAADGLHFAHELRDAMGDPLKIVHRDISPQNVLVSRFGDVKVTDFGVAKAASQGNKTRTGIIKGKVSYMSPEQCLAEDLDRRTDVFARGIVLYELLTRRRLYREKSDLKVMQRITQEETKPPSHLNPKVDQELDDIALTALAKDRDARFDNAADLAEALDRWLATHRKTDCKNRMAKWIKEHAEGVGPVVKPAGNEPGSKATPSWGVMGQAVADGAPSTKSTPSLANAVSPLAGGDATLGEQQTLVLPADNDVTLANEPTVRAQLDPELLDNANAPTAEGSEGMLPAPGDLDDGPTDKSLQTLALQDLAYEPAPEKSKAPMGIAAAVGLVIVLAVGGYFAFSGGGGTEDPGQNGAGNGSQTPGPGDEKPVTATKVKLTIKTHPKGVAVSVNGREAGKTPVTVDVDPGEARIMALFSDQPPVTKELQIKGSDPVEVEIAAKVALDVKTKPPSAYLTVNGELLGKTPKVIPALLEPGAETKILLELDGHEKFTSTVVAEKGVTKVVEVTLKEEAKKVVTPTGGNTGKKPRKPREAAPGTLTLNTDPYTVVYFEGKKLAPTPLFNVEMPAGSHKLVLKNPELGISTSTRVKIGSKKLTTLNLRIKMGSISFDALPPGVGVTVDGKSLGNTPLRPLSVYPGTRRVTLVQGGKKRTVKVTVLSGKTKKVR